MAGIHNLSTILVGPQSPNSFAETQRKTEEGPRPRLSTWAQCLWNFLCLCYAYGTFLGEIPFDVLMRNILVAPGSANKDVYLTVEEQRESEAKCARQVGQLALHPNLPLLAVSTRSSIEVCLYNTVDSQQICKMEVINPKHDLHAQSIKDAVITCLQFSGGNVLAVGLCDGTVRIIKQNLQALVKTWPDSSVSLHQPKIQEVGFLPGHTSDISARFLGPVTNLVFSPTLRRDAGVSAWLAVTTEQSGLWLWSQSTQRTYSTFSTGGVKPGNLHWVRLARELVTESEPLTYRASAPTPAEKITLGQSTIQRFEHVFGSAQDMLTLNECFAPASMKKPLLGGKLSSSPISRRPPPADVADTGDLDGQTVLVVGMKNGGVWVQKVWHSSMIIDMETSVDVPLRHLANSQPIFPSRYHTARVEISHLVVRSVSVGRNAVTVPMLVAFTRDTSSRLHEVVVHLPLKQSVPPIPWSQCVCDGAKEILRQFVNFTLFSMAINYEWLPNIFAPSTDDRVLAVRCLGARSGGPGPSSPFSWSSLISLSITPHRYPAAGALLATLRPTLPQPNRKPQPNSCVLLSPSDSKVSRSALDQLARIIPQRPNPFPVPRKPLPQGYYSRMMALLEPSEDYHHQIPYASNEPLVEHEYTCGQAGWGMSRNGRLLGAFLYQPASLLDFGVGVALFEVVG